MYLVRPSYFVQRLYPKAVWRKEESHANIYLTFDDGPIPELTPWVLDVLIQYGVKATFFCVGNNIYKNPEIFKRILREKHAVGNHTFDHMDGWRNTASKYLDSTLRCQDVMADNNSNKLFRPPYGKMKRTQLKQLLEQGYSIIMWDVITGDFDKHTSPQQCLSNAIAGIRNGSIVVFHDNIKAEGNLRYALPAFIEYALNKGFEFKTL